MPVQQATERDVGRLCPQQGRPKGRRENARWRSTPGKGKGKGKYVSECEDHEGDADVLDMGGGEIEHVGEEELEWVQV